MASKRHLRRRSCQYKRRYPPTDQGRAEAGRLAARLGLGVYHCPSCGGIHIGHSRWQNNVARREKGYIY